jgi:hypothetical protein
MEIPNADHFLFYDEPNYYAAALAAEDISSHPNPGGSLE